MFSSNFNSSQNSNLERIEKLDNVRSRPDVNEQKLGKLITRQISFWQHPSPDDENQHETLLDDHHQRICVHLNLDRYLGNGKLTKKDALGGSI